MNHDRPAPTLSILMPDTSPERAVQLSMYQCSNVSIRISSTPSVMHSTAQVRWFFGEKCDEGTEKETENKRWKENNKNRQRKT